MNDRRAICQTLSNGFNRIIGAVTVANSEQMKVVGSFFTSSRTKKLGRTDSLSVSILWESCENFFLQYY